MNSAIVTIVVGPEQRLFAAHEEMLSKSPFFADICRAQFFEPTAKRIDLPNEAPEIFSAVLEYLYKGDYTPNINYDKKRHSWFLEDGDGAEIKDYAVQAADGALVLKDTVIYVSDLFIPTMFLAYTNNIQCSAYRYQLPELQRLALKKQGLAVNVQCNTILSSARYAYANTPASDSKLRAHYLALIIRSRNTFKRSGTMQLEMEAGGTALFFDLFVAMVNHLVSLSLMHEYTLTCADQRKGGSHQRPFATSLIGHVTLAIMVA